MRLIYSFALLLMAQYVYGQVTFNKRHHFGFPAAVLNSVVATDSCYYAIGILADSVPPFVTSSVFTKLDLVGEPLFIKTLIDPEKTYETWYSSLTPLSDGTFVTAAITFDSISKTIFIKYDNEGDTLFTKEYLNPFYPDFDWLRPLGGFGVLPDGGYIFPNVITNAPDSNPDTYVIRANSNGDFEWGVSYGDAYRELPKSLVLRPDGNAIIGGVRTNENIALDNLTSQVSLVEVSPDGQILSEFLTPTSIGLRDAANDMILLGDGSLVIASAVGTEIDRPTGNTIYFEKLVFKLGPDLEVEWELTFDDYEPQSQNRLTNIVEVSDGSGFVVAGNDWEPDYILDSFTFWGFLAKASPDGGLVWSRRYVGIDCDNPVHILYDLKETPDGGFIICGESKDGTVETTPHQQGWLLKLDGHGCLVPGCHLSDATDEEGRPELELAIYPNPTSDYLNFQLRKVELMKNGIFRIIDAQGSMVREFEDTSQDATYIVPVWDWAAGVYFLQYVEEGVVRASERFVVMR